MHIRTVEEYRSEMDTGNLVTLDALRAIISRVNGDLIETIKWNAPNYALNGEDRITLGIERKGGIRVVFHRGAKVKDMSDFSFEDSTNLARWPSPDRGVAVFKDVNAVEKHTGDLLNLCRSWLSANS